MTNPQAALIAASNQVGVDTRLTLEVADIYLTWLNEKDAEQDLARKQREATP